MEKPAGERGGKRRKVEPSEPAAAASSSSGAISASIALTPSAAVPKDSTKGRPPNDAEVGHLLQFLLAQLRWQHGTLVDPAGAPGAGAFAAFDAECARLDPVVGARDLASMAPLMDAFFARHAKGDRWVPFHCVLGTVNSPPPLSGSDLC